MDDLIKFISDSELIIHNAPFDVGFLIMELTRLEWPKTLLDYCQILDTLILAREKHPGQRNNLDALCKRYDIQHYNRALHGALLDANILAAVYLAMTGGQSTLFADTENNEFQNENTALSHQQNVNSPTPIILASQEEQGRHVAFIKLMREKSKVDLFSDAEETMS